MVTWLAAARLRWPLSGSKKVTLFEVLAVFTMQLPDDLVAFLQAGNSLHYDASQCECGSVNLRTIEEIEEIQLRVSSYQKGWAFQDPHADDEGFYVVPCFDLLAESSGYNPRGLLVYIPALNLYGAHDDDHQDLRVFPRKTWTDIAASPLKYLNDLWNPHKGVGKTLIPVGCEFTHTA